MMINGNAPLECRIEFSKIGDVKIVAFNGQEFPIYAMFPVVENGDLNNILHLIIKDKEERLRQKQN